MTIHLHHYFHFQDYATLVLKTDAGVSPEVLAEITEKLKKAKTDLQAGQENLTAATKGD
jgi:hypothetical protein